MAPVAILQERRREPRLPASGTRCSPDAILRPGQRVMVVNISSRGALLESEGRLRPGAHTELQMAIGGRRTSVTGRLDRCYVAALDPLRYRGVVLFEQPFVVEALHAKA